MSFQNKKVAELVRPLKWCRKHGYNFSEKKALEIHRTARDHVAVMPKSDTTKLLVRQAITQLRTVSSAKVTLQNEMDALAASLPEYPVVMDMFGVCPKSGP